MLSRGYAWKFPHVRTRLCFHEYTVKDGQKSTTIWIGESVRPPAVKCTCLVNQDQLKPIPDTTDFNLRFLRSTPHQGVAAFRTWPPMFSYRTWTESLWTASSRQKFFRHGPWGVICQFVPIAFSIWRDIFAKMWLTNCRAYCLYSNTVTIDEYLGITCVSSLWPCSQHFGAKNKAASSHLPQWNGMLYDAVPVCTKIAQRELDQCLLVETVSETNNIFHANAQILQWSLSAKIESQDNCGWLRQIAQRATRLGSWQWVLLILTLPLTQGFVARECNVQFGCSHLCCNPDDPWRTPLDDLPHRSVKPKKSLGKAVDDLSVEIKVYSLTIQRDNWNISGFRLGAWFSACSQTGNTLLLLSYQHWRP